MSRWYVGKLIRTHDGEPLPSWRSGEGVIVESEADFKKFVKEFHFIEENAEPGQPGTEYPLLFNLNAVMDVGSSYVSVIADDLRDEKVLVEVIGFIEGDEDA